MNSVLKKSKIKVLVKTYYDPHSHYAQRCIKKLIHFFLNLIDNGTLNLCTTNYEFLGNFVIVHPRTETIIIIITGNSLEL